jgi:hypothetical protein
MVDPGTPASTKLRAADSVLAHTIKAMETDDIEVRVTALERAAEENKSGRRRWIRVSDVQLVEARQEAWAEVVDESGFPPHSAQWLAYWIRWFQRTMNNEDPPGRAPFEAVLAIMRAKEW